MFSSDRDTMRKQYVEAWRKFRAGEVMTPLEDMIARVIVDHPEYHALLESGEKGMQREYLPEDGETNPFLHMGMHLAIREQVGTDRPPGIRAVHRQLSERHGGTVPAEHRMIDCLAEVLWRAQRDQTAPDEQAYLRDLEALLRR